MVNASDLPTKDLRAKLVRGVAWSAVSKWGRLVLSFLTFAILARLLGPEAYGLAAMVFAVLAFSEVLVGSAALESLIQRKDLESGHSDAMFWAMQGLALALCVLTFAAAPWIAEFFGQPVLTELLPVAVLVVFVRAQSAVPETLMRRDLRFGALTMASTSSVLVGSLVGVVMAFSGYGVWSLIAMNLAGAAVQAVAVWVLSGWLPSGSATWRHFKDLSRFNLCVLLRRSIKRLDQSLPAILIGPELGAAALGLFSMACKLVNLLCDAIIGPVRNIALPAFSRVNEDLPRVRRLLLGATRITSTVTFPAFVGAIVVAPYLVPMAFGPEWSEGVVLFQVLALMGIRKSIGSLNSAVLRGLGRPDWQLTVACIGTALGVLMILIARDFGIVAIAVAVTLRSFVTWPVSAYFVRRLTNIAFLSQVAPLPVPVMATLVMAACVLSWQLALAAEFDATFMLAGAVAVGVFSYAAVIVLVGRSSLREAVAFATGSPRRGRKIAARSA